MNEEYYWSFYNWTPSEKEAKETVKRFLIRGEEAKYRGQASGFAVYVRKEHQYKVKVGDYDKYGYQLLVEHGESRLWKWPVPKTYSIERKWQPTLWFNTDTDKEAKSVFFRYLMDPARYKAPPELTPTTGRPK